MGVDRSVPSSPARQATVSAVVVVGGQVVSEPWSTCGRVSANEAELIAVQSGLSVATHRPEATTIFVFSDSLSAIRKATNAPSSSSNHQLLELARFGRRIKTFSSHNDNSDHPNRFLFIYLFYFLSHQFISRCAKAVRPNLQTILCLQKDPGLQQPLPDAISNPNNQPQPNPKPPRPY